ncbi:MAG TPA: hypothetical protein VGC79_13390 [Polyangiaceae bacterium]
MIETVQRLVGLESAGISHEGRLLVLIEKFTSGPDAEGVRGMTKLAKLDFLLRYPTYLERALQARKRSILAVKVRDFERLSVEARMVRYRFGPWDHRYPEILRRLSARGLISIAKEGRTVVVKTTATGTALAEQLAVTEPFADISSRSSALRTHFNLAATTLMKFIYETFPEVISLRANAEIDV